VEVGVLCRPAVDMAPGQPARRLMDALLGAGVDARINEPYGDAEGCALCGSGAEFDRHEVGACLMRISPFALGPRDAAGQRQSRSYTAACALQTGRGGGQAR
jgi:hypothetical protein